MSDPQLPQDPQPPVPAAQLAEGRTLVRVNLWRIFWVSAVVAWVAARAEGTGSTAWLRLAAIALMCVLVYRGRRWALWMLGFFAVLAGVLMVLLALLSPKLQLFDRVLFALLGAVQVIAFVILVKAPSVRAFMAAQRHGGTGADAGPTA